jgi:hypothetical protein
LSGLAPRLGADLDYAVENLCPSRTFDVKPDRVEIGKGNHRARTDLRG